MKSSLRVQNNPLFKQIFLFLFGVFIASSDALAQECSGEVDSNEKAINYSLYWESFKNKDYQNALPYLKWILRCAPGFAGPGKSDDRNFERAVKLYEELANQADDPAIKRAYLDTALTYFDTAPSTLKDVGATFNEYEWIRNKGRFIQSHADELDDLQNSVGDLYRQVFDGDPDLLNPRGFYVNTIIASYVRDDRKDEAIEFMEQAEERFGDDPEVANVIEVWRGQLFDTPEERMTFLEEQLEKNPNDIEIIDELIDIYGELEEREKLADMLARRIEIAPTAKAHIAAGIMKLNDGDARGAIEEFKSAAEMPDGDQYAKEINFNLGNAYRELGNLAQARIHYQRALRADPSFGQALFEISSLYAEAVRECGGSKMEREDRAVYWLVVDYLEKARAADRSLSNRVSRTIQQYRPYFPTAEDLFFKGWKEGEPYKIDYGCYSWINETTTVRKP